MNISILDQSPISEGFTGADALRNTLDLARLADDSAFRATGSRNIMALRCSLARVPK